MSTLSAIEYAVCYIEDHLADALSISDLAKRSGYSEFYFQRLFSAVCEVSAGEYIRSRRMSMAAAELLNSDCRITELAYKYGYETPESFTKAFHRFHGASPSEIRQQKQPAKRFARIIVSHSTAPLAFHVIKRQRFSAQAADFRFQNPSTAMIFLNFGSNAKRIKRFKR